MPSGLRPKGSLAVALTDDDLDELRTFADRLAGLGRRCGLLDAAQCRSLEPMLTSAIIGGLGVPDDLAVDNRALLARCDKPACFGASHCYRPG